jgi:hypothetical protein
MYSDLHAFHCNISTWHVIISMLIGCGNIKRRRSTFANYRSCAGGVVLAGTYSFCFLLFILSVYLSIIVCNIRRRGLWRGRKYTSYLKLNTDNSQLTDWCLIPTLVALFKHIVAWWFLLYNNSDNYKTLRNKTYLCIKQSGANKRDNLQKI